MKCFKLNLSCVLFCLTLSGLASAAADEPSFGGQIRQQLSGYEWRADLYRWQANEETVQVLAGIVQNKAEPNFIRGRALAVLSSIDSPLASRALKRFVSMTSLGPLRRRVVDELCSLGTQEQTAITQIMISLLASEDPRITVRAAHCLQGFSPSEDVAAALEVYFTTASQWQKAVAGKVETHQ